MADIASEIDRFLGCPATYGGANVIRIDTHAATVFLAGTVAFKIKKPVRFPFLDFSTLDLRRAAIEREFAINRPNAPELYLGVMAVVRDAAGKLALVPAAAVDGMDVLEWVLKMRRFDEAATLDHLAAQPLAPELIDDLARTVVAAETRAPVRAAEPWIADLADYIRQNDDAFRAMPELFAGPEVAALRAAAEERYAAIAPLLRARGDAGLIRLTHGDLHAGNIAIIDGRPVLFDAIEFDDAIATGDILYDAAFLIMDLDERGRRAEANRFLNGWLLATARAQGTVGAGFAAELRSQAQGLAALPFFLMMRAAIRAKVTASKVAYLSGDAADRARADALRYFQLAIRDLEPVEPRLIAIGGLSGTGKSTLARGLAPDVGHAPGALHLRSDQIRKGLAGIGECERLPVSAYTQEASRAVYETVSAAAEAALAAGWSVIVDTVAARAGERAAFAELASRAGARFMGLWLQAPADVLCARVTARTGDASDADARVVAQQLGYETGDMDWVRIDAGGPAEETLARARLAINSDI